MPTVPGTTAPGMIEFRVQRKRADREQNEGDIGIHQEVEDPLLQGHVEGATEAW